MALKACPECGKEISTDAKTCPNCGAKQPRKVGILGWIAAAFVGVVAYNMVTGDDSASTVPAAPSPAPAPVIYNSPKSSAPPPVPKKAILAAVKIPASKFCPIWGRTMRSERKKPSDLLRAMDLRAATSFDSPLTDDQRDSILHRQVSIGMTACMVYASFGVPEAANRTVYGNHENVQLVYGNNYVYLDDGVVTSFQD